MGWSSYSRLPQLQCPTLVLHGQQDLLIPPQNGRLLASRIAHAELVELPDASHWLHTDQLEATVGAVQQFIHKQSAGAK